MPDTYIRFVTEKIDEDSGRHRGVFQAAADLVESRELEPYELEELQELRGWFDDHLKVPDRFSPRQRKDAAPKALGWFKSSAAEHVSRMHAMCRILEEHGISTQVLTTSRPGYIVYEDEHQVAALPFAETAT